MKLYFSRKTLLEILSEIFVNITSVYLTALLILPIFDIPAYYKVLTQNSLGVIVGLAISLIARENSKRL